MDGDVCTQCAGLGEVTRVTSVETGDYEYVTCPACFGKMMWSTLSREQIDSCLAAAHNLAVEAAVLAFERAIKKVKK